MNTFDSLFVDRVGNEADDVEAELRQRAAHLVEAVLGLGDDLVEPVLDRPDFLLFGQRTEVSLAAPVLPGTADPLIKHPPAVELDDVLELHDEIGELGIVFRRSQFVRDLERDGHDHAGILRQRRLRHQDLVIATLEPLHHFGRQLLAREVEEVLLDVLNLEGSLLQAVPA